jgi:hypothetical protein
MIPSDGRTIVWAAMMSDERRLPVLSYEVSPTPSRGLLVAAVVFIVGCVALLGAFAAAAADPRTPYDVLTPVCFGPWIAALGLVQYLAVFRRNRRAAWVSVIGHGVLAAIAAFALATTFGEMIVSERTETSTSWRAFAGFAAMVTAVAAAEVLLWGLNRRWHRTLSADVPRRG